MADEAFPARLWEMADLFTPMALRVAATLRLADHVAGGAHSVPAPPGCASAMCNASRVTGR